MASLAVSIAFERARLDVWESTARRSRDTRSETGLSLTSASQDIVVPGMAHVDRVVNLVESYGQFADVRMLTSIGDGAESAPWYAG
ncbi:hypothetical protein SAMN06272789_5281 [Streptomyces sp. 1331.2]|nr:hypothetical protein SAMN06272789_5281 [Streptomyces sp. 1331.2]